MKTTSKMTGMMKTMTTLFSFDLPSSFEVASFFLKTLKSDFFSTKIILSFKICMKAWERFSWDKFLFPKDLFNSSYVMKPL